MSVLSIAAVIWWLSDEGTAVQEASTNGRRQGVTSKNRHRPEARYSNFTLCSLPKGQVQ